jgi:hypothetical protein
MKIILSMPRITSRAIKESKGMIASVIFVVRMFVKCFLYAKFAPTVSGDISAAFGAMNVQPTTKLIGSTRFPKLLANIAFACC